MAAAVRRLETVAPRLESSTTTTPDSFCDKLGARQCRILISIRIVHKGQLYSLITAIYHLSYPPYVHFLMYHQSCNHNSLSASSHHPLFRLLSLTTCPPLRRVSSQEPPRRHLHRLSPPSPLLRMQMPKQTRPQIRLIHRLTRNPIPPHQP